LAIILVMAKQIDLEELGERKERFDTLAQELVALRDREDQAPLAMGDVLARIEEELGEKWRREAVRQAGLKKASANQRLRVARRYSKESGFRVLSFSVLRELDGMDDQERGEWEQKALDGKWSLKALKEAVTGGGQPAERKCGFCEAKPQSFMFRLYIGNGKAPVYLCGMPCLRSLPNKLDKQLNEALKSGRDAMQQRTLGIPVACLGGKG
jgi:hypothetical protein